MINIQKYVRAKSLEEAYTLNQKKKNRILAGMLWTRMESGNVPVAIDLCDLGLDKIEENEEEFSIGAMVTLRQLQMHESFENYCDGIVAKAVKDIIGVQLYKGGVIPLEQFARMQYDRDLLVRVIVKKKPGVFSYQAMRVQKTDFPILTCGVSRMDGVCKAVIGARPGKAVCIHDDRHLLDGEVTEKKAEAFAEYVAEQVTTGSNMRGSAEYRTHLVKILTGRGVMELGGVRA